MSLVRFSIIARNDGKVGIFSPEAKTGATIDKGAFETVWLEMMKRGHPEIMPNNVLGGLGLSFGEMSQTAFQTLISLIKRCGGEVMK